MSRAGQRPVVLPEPAELPLVAPLWLRSLLVLRLREASSLLLEPDEFEEPPLL